MEIDTSIQTGTIADYLPRVVRGSDGTLYTAYVLTSNVHLCVAYSYDGGETWTEIDSGIVGNNPAVSIAIDSTDTIHCAYMKGSDSKLYWVTFSDGGFDTPELVQSSGTVASTGTQTMGIAIDSTDTPHVIWKGPSSFIYYSSRAGGTWSAQLQLNPLFATNVYGMAIAIDSNNYIHVVYASNSSIYHLKYTNFWTVESVVSNTSVNNFSYPNLVIDSSDNVFLIWNRTTPALVWSKYNAGTGLWSAEAVITLGTTTAASNPSTLMIDSTDVISLFYSSSAGDIFIVQYSGTWSSESKILDATSPDNFFGVMAQSTIWPIIGAVSVNIPTAGYQFLYYNVTGTKLRFYSSADIDFPAPVTENYSREASVSLALDDTNLSNLFTATEYVEVSIDDAIYADQTATNKYAVVLFKNKSENPTDEIHVSWTGKTSIAPSVSTVYLQIYNRDTGLWETLASDNTSAAGSNFTLTGEKISSVSDYYDGGNWVSCRVYQLAQ